MKGSYEKITIVSRVGEFYGDGISHFLIMDKSGKGILLLQMSGNLLNLACWSIEKKMIN